MVKQKKKKSPEFVRYFDSVIKALAGFDGVATPAVVGDTVARMLHIPDDERHKLSAKGQPLFDNRVRQARQFLFWAGYIDAPQRGIWRLTRKGWEIRAISYRKACRIYHEQWKRHHPQHGTKAHREDIVEESAVPLEVAHRPALLSRLRKFDPAEFERFFTYLLSKWGFVPVAVTGRSNDGGIDGHGTYRPNPCVSFKVLFQCKRYQAHQAIKVGQIRDFIGALTLKNADRGIFVTTSYFTDEATKAAASSTIPCIELIDGQRLCELLEQEMIGLTAIPACELDPAFFEDFEGHVKSKSRESKRRAK